MHKNNFVVAVKVNGKVLREFDNSVYIPFGSEYSILLKNLSNTRVRVNVSIDGTDALDGANLIIDKKQEMDLARYIKNGNLERGNAFKFIEKTAAVSKHRGDKAEDGLITISYEFENDVIAYIGGSISKAPDYHSNYPQYPHNGYPQTFVATNHLRGAADTVLYSATISDTSDEELTSKQNSILRGTLRSAAAMSATSSQPKQLVPTSDPTRAGVTAPGSVNDQKFVQASYFFSSGKVETMTLQLLGQVGEVEVTRPVQVQKQITCQMCGKNARQTDKFCSQCGASVEIV